MWSDLQVLAAARGVELSEQTITSFHKYFDLITAANRELNLTRITDPREVMVKHFLDSLELLTWRHEPRGMLLDVGSGAGLPGIPLKIARPELEVVLLDSSRKKINYLEDTITKLEIAGISALHSRAEDLAKLEDWRDSADLVVSRALASLNILLELCLPFVRPGGVFIAYKGPTYETDLQATAPALSLLNGRHTESRPYTLPFGMGGRALLIFEKTGVTPRQFPRRAGMPHKRPLT
ncbi:MAG: 16S rRNA (guanine(527)-N(7))-methyltransferase RsmG [Dethiobacter sp.]|jgi:16S rRNA (guanine527-N7)-methyltransferase|nr:16S rRNA (guanine(527)-N(7))-methyltransferase RsmG [Dethiobacter sp.]